MVWRMGTFTKLVRYQWLAQLMATVIREKYGIVCNIFVLAHAVLLRPLFLYMLVYLRPLFLHMLVCVPQAMYRICALFA